MVHTFEEVLRDRGKQWIIELTYKFNDQETVEDARNVLNEAIDNNWRPVLMTPACAGAQPEPTLMNPLETVKQIAENFLNYRESLKLYIQKLLDTATEAGVLTSTEAESIRDLFWEVEVRLQTNFDVVLEMFFKRIKESYSEGVSEKLQNISVEVIASDTSLKLH